MSPRPRRVGVFGGAFDPPHRAHVALAEAALQQLQLDELRIFPTGQAWHKERELTAAEHRLAMVRMAFAQTPRIVVDERELRRPGATYTVDTLRELHAEQRQAQLFLVMGEDQARDFTSWREWQAIAALATLCVAERGASQGGIAALEALPNVSTRALQLPLMRESATEIRARVAAGQDIAALVAANVASYIAQNHLYRNP